MVFAPGFHFVAASAYQGLKSISQKKNDLGGKCFNSIMIQEKVFSNKTVFKINIMLIYTSFWAVNHSTYGSEIVIDFVVFLLWIIHVLVTLTSHSGMMAADDRICISYHQTVSLVYKSLP